MRADPLPRPASATIILAISAMLWGGVIALCFAGWPS